MTALSTYVDLDDADAVLAADRSGSLHSAALAGAQVRAVSSAVREGALSVVDGLRPRCVVLVVPGGVARRAAAVVTAALASQSGVPVAVVSSTPPWVGPLDVVLVAGDDAGDPAIVQSVAAGVRRRAEVIVAVPDEGPTAEAGAGRVTVMPPRVRVSDRNALFHHAAVIMAVLGAVDPTSIRPDLESLADVLDGEIVRHHASVEVFRNPAKSLASRMSGRRVVLTGDDPVATEVAHHGAAVLLRASGLVVASAELADVVGAVHELGGIGGDLGSEVRAGYDPMFHDDELDGPRPSDPVRVFVVSATADADDGVRRRVAVLGDVDVIRVDDASGPSDASGPRASDAVVAALVSAVRIEAAAAYVRIAGGNTTMTTTGDAR